ncbi:ribosome maturation factor RimM [Alloalcanivorax gelatiniphagus]|uniref:Ribosome maturation factor RimM n=1 Tax=Alloalcanivorax gelatiniphagus TaxID=1194167 RepID=A0ABY2XR39_9GAMM|nr:ribosome maturation factor RimM [Alloalcanivorax gelatiniphagus]TMW14719.1 ribosome maturation factor RimM [Alloalcanivorax gelatiniphagus]
MLTPDEVLVVGRIVSVHGVKGWVKVYSYTDPIENIFDYQPWYLFDDGAWREVKLGGRRRQGKGLVAGLDGYDDREQARRELVGREIAVPRSQLPESGDDEYYWRDLIGLRVKLDDGRDLGRVHSLMETGANDVLVVRGDGDSLDRQERLLPWTPGQVVRDVDLDAGELRVDWDPEF